jgi:hypothetical protein
MLTIDTARVFEPLLRMGRSEAQANPTTWQAL